MKYKPLRQARYERLITGHFSELEAREFSVLPRDNPALKKMYSDRQRRRAKFEHLASVKIRNGKWSRDMVASKWLANLSRFYSKMGYRVKQGPTGAQRWMPKRGVNPWSWYRDALKEAPNKPPYESPWKSHRRSSGKASISQSNIEDLRKRTEERKSHRGRRR